MRVLKSTKSPFFGLVGPLFYYFFAVFPTSSPIDRRLPWLKQVLLGLAVAVSVLLGVWALLAGSFQPLLELGDRVLEAGLGFLLNGFIFGTCGLGFVSLLWNALRATTADVRRKTRVIVFGTVVGVGPATLLQAAGAYLNRSPFEDFPYWIVTPCILVTFLLPLSVAYAVVRHRVLGVPQLLRLGLQYAFARKLLLSLVPLLAGLLLLDLLLHADPLIDVLRARGWVYGVLGGLALVTHTQRQRWLGTLDRQFFRERYDARRLLGEVVKEVGEATSFEQVAPRAVARIEAALHAEFVAVSMLNPNETSFRNVASAPAGRAPLALAVDSKVVALLQVLGKPLEVSLSGTSWLKQQLPHEETDYLRQSRIDLLVPIAGGPGRTQALLALGPKRSEEPYTGEDQELLVSIATSLALLLDRPMPAPAPQTDAFEECPQCGACYDTGVSQCAEDGARLSQVGAPRLLSDRYRLDRRIGRGGMGTVYVATDAALERRVAAKVIRDDLVGSVDAADRFRREARATAAFSHPNVVTVHDFGVDRDTRAFLVMELLEGTNLLDELTRETRLPADRSLRILRSVCAAVEAAHARDLVHRDLKPENIFLTRGPTGEVTKVLDFGIAKFVSTTSASEAATAEGTVLGTVRYMSPEQLRGGTVRPAWDLWALTVVAYEMLTGAHPFAGATIDETHQAILGARCAPVATHLPAAPAGAQALFARAFAVDPADRPGSAAALLRGFEQGFSPS